MSAFVIEYHRASGDYRVSEYSGPSQRRLAIERRFDLERQHPRDDDWEIVSLHADSLETIKHTHSRYFLGQELKASRQP